MFFALYADHVENMASGNMHTHKHESLKNFLRKHGGRCAHEVRNNLERIVRIMHIQDVRQCTSGGLGVRWSMVAVGYVRLGRTEQSNGSTRMSVGIEDDEDQ